MHHGAAACAKAQRPDDTSIIAPNARGRHRPIGYNGAFPRRPALSKRLAKRVECGLTGPAQTGTQRPLPRVMSVSPIFIVTREQP
jgi:hypothetical protein